MQAYQTFTLHRGAVLVGMLAGLALVLIVTGVGALMGPQEVGLGEVLGRLLLIYGGAGLAAGLVVEAAERQHGRARRYAPSGLHAYLAALGVSAGHALVLMVQHGGDFAHLAFFGAEVFVVTVLAGVVGGFAGDVLRAIRPVTA
jgi:hypothetical protein